MKIIWRRKEDESISGSGNFYLIHYIIRQDIMKHYIPAIEVVSAKGTNVVWIGLTQITEYDAKDLCQRFENALTIGVKFKGA